MRGSATPRGHAWTCGVVGQTGGDYVCIGKIFSKMLDGRSGQCVYTGSLCSFRGLWVKGRVSVCTLAVSALVKGCGGEGSRGWVEEHGRFLKGVWWVERTGTGCRLSSVQGWSHQHWPLRKANTLCATCHKATSVTRRLTRRVGDELARVVSPCDSSQCSRAVTAPCPLPASPLSRFFTCRAPTHTGTISVPTSLEELLRYV